MRYISKIGVHEVIIATLIIVVAIILINVHNGRFIESRDFSNVNTDIHKNIKKVNLSEVSLESIEKFSNDTNCSNEKTCNEFSIINNKLEEYNSVPLL